MSLRRDAACSVSVEEDLEEDDWVIDVLKERVDGQLGAKLCPLFPVCVGGSGSTRNYCERDGMLRSTEIIDERTAGVGVHMRQDCV